MRRFTFVWRSFARPSAVLITIILVALAVAAPAQTSIFSVQKTPSPNVLGNTLNAVGASSTSNAWAVGFQNDNNLNESRTLIEHWNGKKWKKVASPNPGSPHKCQGSNSGNVLTAVAAIAPDDAWAVGYFFSCTSLLQPMALHWDGKKWKAAVLPKIHTNDNAAFNGVVALATDDVYAVGYQPATNGAVLTLIEHWDGKAWSVVSSPNANGTGNVLTSVSANSPTDIWAVGDQVAPGIEARTLALHFDGINWSVVSTPNVVQGDNLDENVLTSVVAVAPNDVTAVGFSLANQTELTMALHWDGVSWSVVPTPNVSSSAGSFNTLHGVTAVNGSDLYAVGFFANSSTNGQELTLIEHFDGMAWSIVTSPVRDVAQQLNGVFALPGTTDVWAAGATTVDGIDPESGFLQVPITLMLFASGA